MKATPELARRFANARAVAVYPGSPLEILGYVTENGEGFAYVRRNDNLERISKVLIRYNGHDEAYCSLTVNGQRQRVYLSDCRRCIN